MTVDDLIARPEAISMLVEKLHLSKRTVSDKVLKRSDFPKPKKKIGRAELYNRVEIERFLMGK